MHVATALEESSLRLLLEVHDAMFNARALYTYLARAGVRRCEYRLCWSIETYPSSGGTNHRQLNAEQPICPSFNHVHW